MRYTIEKEQEVKKLAEEGKSSQYICSMTGIPERVIWSWCPSTRPHDDVIKWSVKQRFHNVFPDFEARISSAISPLVRPDISEDEWEDINKVIYNTLFDEAIIVFKNLLMEPPEFGSEKKLSKEPFLDYLKSFWSMDSDYVKEKNLSENYVLQNKNSIHYWSLLKKNKVFEINSGDIERVFENLSSKELSQYRINAIMQTALIPLKVAYKKGLILNRCFEFYLPRPENNKEELSPITVSKIFNAEWKCDEAFLANLIAYYCKLQLQEVRALRIQDISTDSITSNNIFVNTKGLIENKNKKTCTIPPTLSTAILKYASTSPYPNLSQVDFIFYSEKRNRPSQGHKWSSELHKICKKIGIKEINFRSWS